MSRRSYPTDERTSRRMQCVRSTDTTPEKVVHRLVSELGVRCRRNCKDLPGRPDIVIPSVRKVIFVHGCFWHRHLGCKRCSTPKRNVALWQEKFERTVRRDRVTVRRLRKMGWEVLVVWECTLRNARRLVGRIAEFLD